MGNGNVKKDCRGAREKAADIDSGPSRDYYAAMRRKRLVIVKTGSTMPALAAKLGDFEDWTVKGMGPEGDTADVVDVRSGATLPDREFAAGIVVTGSHDMVTERLEWSERTAAWLAECVGQGIPVLGICYGHQLLAHALGGLVADNPAGREFGTRTVKILPEAADDPLLGGFGDSIRVHLCHTQSVIGLPQGAVRLASSSMDPNQAFRLGKSAWGLQFHPEFPAAAMRAYVREYAKILAAEGGDPLRLEAESEDSPYGDAILHRFAAIAAARS